MTEILLFHHAQGLTAGIAAFAEDLEAAGHTVHTPDLYDGHTFANLDDGVAYAQGVGFATMAARADAVAEALPADLVYAGFSLGAVQAQRLAQTRAGARGLLLFSAALPPSEFGAGWPGRLPAQIHLMDADPWGEEDLPAARELASEDGVELFLYPGSAHLFADSSLADHDEAAAALLKQRVLEFLA